MTTDPKFDAAQPRLHQHARETQVYGTVTPRLPLGLSVEVREEVVGRLNQVLADTLTLRDLYKKAHWQAAGPTFYQLHLLFDKHAGAQADLADAVAERVQTLGGVSLAMAGDVADTTNVPRPPRGREAPPVQLSRLLDAHGVVILEARSAARRAAELGDDGSNDLLVSQVLRANELEVWFLSEHLVDAPLAVAE